MLPNQITMVAPVHSQQEKEHHEDDEILKELKKVQAELRTVVGISTLLHQ